MNKRKKNPSGRPYSGDPFEYVLILPFQNDDLALVHVKLIIVRQVNTTTRRNTTKSSLGSKRKKVSQKPKLKRVTYVY